MNSCVGNLSKYVFGTIIQVTRPNGTAAGLIDLGDRIFGKVYFEEPPAPASNTAEESVGRTGLVTLDFKARNRLRSRFPSCNRRAILRQSRDVSESPNLNLNLYPKHAMFPRSKSYTRILTAWAGFGGIPTTLDPMSCENGTCSTVEARLWPCLSVRSP